MRFDEHFIRKCVADVSIIGTLPSDPCFVIDSRVTKKNDLFVALKGDRNDGHAFIEESFKRGAAGAIIATDKKDWCIRRFGAYRNVVFIIVPDPLSALILLAIAWRQQFFYPVVGVTGSIGKTSAKETIASVLKAAGKAFVVSQGNQNTKIGAAINLLRMRSYHEVAVFEIASNRRGEIANITQMVRPTIGVITGIGHCHMEGLGSLHDIAFEKRDIFKCFTEKNIGIVNGDQPLISHASFVHPVIKFGCKTTNQIQMRKIRMDAGKTKCVLKIYKDKYDIVLPKFHASVINSALVAASVGHILSIDASKILEGIQAPIVIPGRFEKKRLNNGKGFLINDCYNANPENMKAALLAFQYIETKIPKVAVLGDMLELGVNSPFWHRQIGRFLRKTPSIKKLLLVGHMVEWVEKTLPIGVQAVRVANWQEAREQWAHVIGEQEVYVLVKGSHGIGLLNLIDCFTA